MGGASSKSVNETTMRLTDITNNVTRNVTENSQSTIANIKGVQAMTVSNPKFFGCEGGIKQGMKIEQDVKATLTSEQILEANTAIKSELVNAMESDIKQKSGALRLPVGGDSSTNITRTEIDEYIETNNLMENVVENMQTTAADISASQEANIISPYFDPCGIGVFQNALANADGYSLTELAEGISSLTTACGTPKPKCEIEQDMLVKQVVSAGVEQVARNVTKFKKEKSIDTSSTSKTSQEQMGALSELGDGTAKAAEGVGDGLATAAEGAGKGLGDAGKGLGEGVATAVSPITDVLGNPVFIVGAVCVVGVGGYLYWKSQQKSGGLNLGAAQ
jgi:hypothetical protein